EKLRLLARRLELLALAEVGREGHDLAAIGRLQPLEDDRGVEPARIGQHYFLDVAFRHAALPAKLAVAAVAPAKCADVSRPVTTGKSARTIGVTRVRASSAVARPHRLTA